VYVGLPSNWGYDFRVGSVPVYNYVTKRPTSTRWV